jgi:hypothetical protein
MPGPKYQAWLYLRQQTSQAFRGVSILSKKGSFSDAAMAALSAQSCYGR